MGEIETRINGTSPEWPTEDPDVVESILEGSIGEGAIDQIPEDLIETSEPFVETAEAPQTNEADREADSKLQNLNGRILQEMARLSGAEVRNGVDEIARRETDISLTLTGMREVLSQFEYGHVGQAGAVDVLESNTANLVRLLGQQETVVAEELVIPVRQIQGGVEADIAPDTRAFLGRRADEGVNIDIGPESYLKERVQRAESVCMDAWTPVIAIENRNNERKETVAYRLNVLVGELRDDHWGAETIVAQLNSVIYELEDTNYRILGHLQAFRDVCDQADAITRIEEK